MNRLGDYAIGYQGSDDPFENYIDEYPIATKREIWKQAHREGWEQCQREAVSAIKPATYPNNKFIVNTIFECAEAIANMEYKEPTDD